MDFTKIKWNGKEVHLEWTTKSAGAVVEHKLSCGQAPEKRLEDALQSLVPDVLELCELPEEQASKVRVIGLSLKHEDEAGLGVVITSLKTLSASPSPLVLNTPYLTEEPRSEESPSMSTRMAVRVEAVCKAAERYVEGHREQGDLFLDAEIHADEMEPAGV